MAPGARQLRRIGPDDWADWRAIRLRALADSPRAFGSTLAREQVFAEADWRQRLEGPAVLAYDDAGTPVAMGGTYLHEPGRAHLVGMWTAPARRRTGLATAILDDLVGRARDQHLAVRLWVNTSNAAACAAYRNYGFVRIDGRMDLHDGDVAEQLELPAS